MSVVLEQGSEAIFMEHANQPTPRRRLFPELEPVDVGLAGGFGAVVIGFALIWLPLAFIVPGGIVAAICLWRVLR